MSRHVPLSHEFDQKSFLELLSKAQGDRQQKEFAADIGMSKTYLNAFLTGKKNKPFTPQLLKKVSRAAHGRVTFEELLVASGYDPKPYLKDEIEDEYRWLENDPEFSMAPEYGQEDGRLLVVEKAMLGAITTTMAEKGYKFSGNPYPYAPRLNFKVELYDLPITEWGFILLKVRPSEMESEDSSGCSKKRSIYIVF